MKGDQIPASDNLALHCSRDRGVEFGATGNATGITRDALRVDGDGISTNWIEYDGGNLAQACMLIAGSRHVRASNLVGHFNVGDAMTAGANHGRKVVAIHDPIDDAGERNNPGHALVTGVLATDEAVLDEIAMGAAIEEFPAAAVAASRVKFKK